MNPPILEVRGLRKTFGSLVAVEEVSFSVAAGECVGLLGPNGAGKTTTLSMLAGLIRPDAGEVLIAGRALTGDTDPAKRRLGLVPQDLALYEDLSAAENLAFFGALYSLSRAELRDRGAAALDLVGLSGRAKDPPRTFSGGMKRRLNLAVALLHDPEILLLDEPTVGVDPQSRNAIFDNLETLRARGKTILYTTHYLEEVERLCSRVVIVDHGRVLADAPLAELRAREGEGQRCTVELAAPAPADWIAALRGLPGVRRVAARESQLIFEVADLTVAVPAVTAWLAQHGAQITQLSSARPNLESVFLSLTGRNLRDD